MSKIPADKSQGTERNLIDRRALIHLRATMFYFERNAVGETPTAILFFEIIRTQICVHGDLNLGCTSTSLTK
jgi:hypothetical protein